MTISVRSPKLAMIATLFAVIGAPAVNAAEVTILMDEARLVTLDRPAKTVFVGNAMIADATVIDPNHVFVSGRNFGVTNLVAVDDAGRQISSTPVTVLERGGLRVTLQRGPGRSTFACSTSRCEATPTPGDDPAYYTPNQTQIDQRQGTSLKASEQ